MDRPKKPPVNKIIDIVANNGFYRDAVKITTDSGTPILSSDVLDFAKNKYYGDVPNMSLDTLRRESDPRRIPYMTIEQLRTLSDELYLTKDKEELPYLFDDLNENGDFPEGLLNDPVRRIVKENWEKGRHQYQPTNLFDNVIPMIVAYTYDFDEEQISDFYDWKSKNERKFFENVYRVLIKPEINNPYPGGKRRTIKRRKNKNKNKKSKQKSSKRRRL
jgi:hypothetical protein